MFMIACCSLSCLKIKIAKENKEYQLCISSSTNKKPSVWERNLMENTFNDYIYNIIKKKL